MFLYAGLRVFYRPTAERRAKEKEAAAAVKYFVV